MALALANDGQLMMADSQTGPRQQVLFYDITDPKQPKLTRAFGDYGGIASGKPGEVTPRSSGASVASAWTPPATFTSR